MRDEKGFHQRRRLSAATRGVPILLGRFSPMSMKNGSQTDEIGLKPRAGAPILAVAPPQHRENFATVAPLKRIFSRVSSW